MVGRRARLQVKPNVGRPTAPTTPSDALVAAQKASSERTGAADETADALDVVGGVDDDGPPLSPDSATPNLAALLSSPPRSRARSPLKTPHSLQPMTPAPELSVACRRTPMASTEPLDRATFTMADLVHWNPQNDSAIIYPGHEGKTSNRGRKRLGARAPQVSPSPAEPVKSSTAVDASSLPAPQVKIGADGRLVLDEESLTVQHAAETAASQLQVVDESRAERPRITSRSYRRRNNVGKIWSAEETDLFFHVLASTGSDFGLMHEFLPMRSRVCLKHKYSREQRLNPKRIHEALSKPQQLDASLYEVQSRLKTIDDLKKQISRTSQLPYECVIDSDADDVHVDSCDEPSPADDADSEDAFARLQSSLNQPSRYGRVRKCAAPVEEVAEQKPAPKKRKATKNVLVKQILSSVQKVAEEERRLRLMRRHNQTHYPAFEAPTASDAKAKSAAPTVKVLLPDGRAVPALVALPVHRWRLAARVHCAVQSLLADVAATAPLHLTVQLPDDDAMIELMLVREPSTVGGQPDMVHIYQLTSPPQPSAAAPQQAQMAQVSDVPTAESL